MAIYFVKEIKTFFLETNNSSYVFRINKFNYLENLHYGAKIAREDVSYTAVYFDRGFSANFVGAEKRSDSLDVIPNEYPVFGNGDSRFSAVLTVDSSGNRLENLKYKSHRILKNKPKINGLPSLRGGETLEIELESHGLLITLYYSVYENQDAVVRRAQVLNKTDNIITVKNFMSASIDLPSADFDYISLQGRHIAERHIERTPLRHGITSIYSNRGTSSHQHNPFCCIAQKNADEYNGEVYSLNYVYGGSFIIQAEVSQFNSLRIQAGFNPFDFSYTLENNEKLDSPETVIVYSDKGINKISQNFHDLYREFLINPNYVKKPRPIVINNWEATYFDFNTEKLFEIIDSCKGLGIDTFVLDDGWFGKRDSDTTGLGDWFVNTKKLKGGLKPIIERCTENGIKFGLWFEPEMISEDSELFRMHPDWRLCTPYEKPASSRVQYVLDLSRKEIVDYLKHTISDILKNNDISYIKWDMNRSLTDVFSIAYPSYRQQEIWHRYMLGFYELAEYLVTNFPDVLFEGCSGGGGRFDPSMLYYFPQCWTSDNTDAYERAKIQYGTSMCYPLSSMSCHVSVCPNHQTERTISFQSRADIASLGSLGYEFDISKLSDVEREKIKEINKTYRENQQLILEGDIFRINNPFDSNSFCIMIVSKDKSCALLTYMNFLTNPNAAIERIKFKGLEKESNYYIKELDIKLKGKTLMNCGLPVLPKKDFTTVTYFLTRE
jgi:alpha-galactosidase